MGDAHARPPRFPVDRRTAVREWIWRHSSQPNGDPWDSDPEHLDRAAQNLLSDLAQLLTSTNPQPASATPPPHAPHLLVDAHGLPLNTPISAADRHDSLLLEPIQGSMPTIKRGGPLGRWTRRRDAGSDASTRGSAVAVLTTSCVVSGGRSLPCPERGGSLSGAGR